MEFTGLLLTFCFNVFSVRFVFANLPKFHQARIKWRANSPCTSTGCGCGSSELSLALAALAATKAAAVAGDAAAVATLGAAEATAKEAAAKVGAFASATRSPSDLTKYVLCGKLPDAKVNGVLRPKVVDAVMSKAKEWELRSPRYLTEIKAKKPFSVYSHYCVNGDCSAGAGPWASAAK